ncbi:cache domain-containing protein [Brevibacterium pigmentatum]|uniref:cache domain-containing protein n=1 Tax=Brevibacterium pigmentatum TaxID=1496080 RepID=UPI0014215877|nr:cache domain-containing protein [Brevibacterium pigmentatum]
MRSERNHKFLADTADTIAERVDSVFASLEALRDAALPIFDAPRVRHEDLAVLEPSVADIIGDHDGLLTGAGVAVSPGALSNTSAWMQSWHVSASGLRFTRHSLNPSSVDFYNYTEMPWYQQPRATREAYISGPYMDFGGTDSRIITAALPVDSWNDSTSVVAADLSLPSFERILLSTIHTFDPETALISPSGRVIATNSASIAAAGKTTRDPKSRVRIPALRVQCSWELCSF